MPEISRISTLGIHNISLTNFTKVQSNLNTLQDQISSGVKGRDFEAYNGQVEQLTGLEKEVKKLNNYIDNNAETISRLRTTENALTEMIELVDDIEDLMVLQRNPANAGNIAFELQIKQLRFAVADELNINLEGRYLFGGTRTDVPPVIDDPEVPDAITPGVADDAYYQGSKQNVIVRAQDNVQLEYEARADNPAFQKLFSALSLAIKAETEGSQENIARALDLTQEALEGIIALRAKVQSERVNVERIVVRQNDTKLYFAGVIEDITKVDIVAAASRVAIDEATLTATFQVFARISALRLSDFLN